MSYLNYCTCTRRTPRNFAFARSNGGICPRCKKNLIPGPTTNLPMVEPTLHKAPFQAHLRPKKHKRTHKPWQHTPKKTRFRNRRKGADNNHRHFLNAGMTSSTRHPALQVPPPPSTSQDLQHIHPTDQHFDPIIVVMESNALQTPPNDQPWDSYQELDELRRSIKNFRIFSSLACIFTSCVLTYLGARYGSSFF